MVRTFARMSPYLFTVCLSNGLMFTFLLSIASPLSAKFLPDLNNEKHPMNATYRENFISLANLVLVRAEGDTQVFPKESEWFGAYADGDAYKKVLGFNETKWYEEDSFGLQTLDRAGKVHFLSTQGNHLQFTNAFLLDVVQKYFAPSPSASPLLEAFST